ncbi:MAG TPA: hypothetical protein VJ739_01650 [Gemmataceae bacterium]|nr:hypothetical protein [Gemmataceae bacterium]
MTPQTLPATEVAIWERLLRPDEDDLSPDEARALLRLGFDPRDVQRMHELARKAQEGELSSVEREDAARYERIGILLGTLQSKARRILAQQGETP